MTAWSDITVAHVGDPDTSGTTKVDNVFASIKAFRDQIAAAFPDGDGPVPWTPRLIVNDANGTNSWTPTTGTNPGLGTGGTTNGRVYQYGKIVWAQGTILFGTGGTTAGSGAYRVSLPRPCTTDANTYSKILGFGHMYDDDAPGTFLGLGPGNYKHFMLHNAPSVTTDVVGLVLGGNLRPSGLSNNGYTVSHHTDDRTLDETAFSSTPTQAQVEALANTVGTMVNDLETSFSAVIFDNASDANPWVWAANDRIEFTLIYETP